MSRNPLRRRNRRQQKRLGATAVEFAIVANVMFVMILTCIEFARLNMVRNLAQDAAYYAARKIIVVGATEADAIAEADGVMGALVTNGYRVEVQSIDFEQDFAQVDVIVDLDEIALFAPMFLPSTEYVASARIRSERYEGFFQQ